MSKNTLTMFRTTKLIFLWDQPNIAKYSDKVTKLATLVAKRGEVRIRLVRGGIQWLKSRFTLNLQLITDK